MTNILQYITCPITKLIFCDPVLSEDGYVYEYMAIKNHLSRTNTSPVTGEKIGNLLVKATIIKKLTEDFLNTNVEYKNDQFLFKKPFYLFNKEFIELLKSEQFEKLKEFTSIVLNHEIGKETLFEFVCKGLNRCPDDVIKHIVDNSIDYDVPDRRKMRPIHFACKHASVDVIRHLIKKGVELESEDNNNERPIGYLLFHKSLKIAKELVNDLLNMKVNINYSNRHGFMPIHHVIIGGDLSMLKMFVDSGFDLSILSPKIGLNLLQYAFRYSSNIDLIKYMIDLNINLDVDVDPKTSCEQLIYQNETIGKKEKQQLVFYYLSKVLNKAVIVDDFIDSVKA